MYRIAITVIALGLCAAVDAEELFSKAPLFEIALPPGAPTGAASLREHAVAWHPVRRAYYLIADVVPLENPAHPNTYETELYLWKSPDLRVWEFLGLAVPKGTDADAYDAHGVASPAGMAFWEGRLCVPFSARRTPAYRERSIGLAWSGENPEELPWTKTPVPVSDLPGEDDDPALVCEPAGRRLHLYHRTTGPRGYEIVHTVSAAPRELSSWPTAKVVNERPPGVRAQELTGAAIVGGAFQIFVIEQDERVSGIRIAHLNAGAPEGPFVPRNPEHRYLTAPPPNVAYGGHATPIVREEAFVGISWTVFQSGPRYGLRGYAIEQGGGPL